MVKSNGKEYKTPFSEETNSCRERFWGFCSQSSMAKPTIKLQEAALYPGWMAGLAEIILK